MKTLFAVMEERGPGWDQNRPLREQALWDEHADFMDDLATRGFIILGGPFPGTEDVMLIFNAKDEQEIHSLLAADPWRQENPLIVVTEIKPWTILLEAGK